jgi:hypothetical protein
MLQSIFWQATSNRANQYSEATVGNCLTVYSFGSSDSIREEPVLPPSGLLLLNRAGNQGSYPVECIARFRAMLRSIRPMVENKWDGHMTEVEKIMGSVAKQLMNGEIVLIEEQKIPVKRVGRGRLRMAQFWLNGRTFEAIEQNPEKPSRWGKLARDKHQVVQFRDVAARKYVAVAVDGEIMEYGHSTQ